MARFPFEFVGDFRGKAAGGDFVNDSGEKVEFSDGLKFEVDLPDGDVELVQIRQSKIDQVASASFDSGSLVKGDRIRFVGVLSSSSYEGSSRVSMRVLAATRETGSRPVPVPKRA